jgi:non-ribosomal peptide synthetase component F
VASQRGATLTFAVPSDLHARLLDLARGNGATLFMVLRAALSVLLMQLGAGEDIVLGCPIAGRTDAALDDLVGFFVNTLVLRADLSGDPSFRDLLTRVREGDLAAHANQDVPFELLVERLKPARSMAHHPLFQVMLVLQNNAEAAFRVDGLVAQPEPVGTGTTKFDLTFGLTERRDAAGQPAGVEGVIEYATDLFDRASVALMAERLIHVLKAVAADPGQPIGEIDVSGEALWRRTPRISGNTTGRAGSRPMAASASSYPAVRVAG